MSAPPGAGQGAGLTLTLERGRTLGVDRGFRLPALPGTPLSPRRLTAVYFDTRDHRLARLLQLPDPEDQPDSADQQRRPQVRQEPRIEGKARGEGIDPGGATPVADELLAPGIVLACLQRERIVRRPTALGQ